MWVRSAFIHVNSIVFYLGSTVSSRVPLRSFGFHLLFYPVSQGHLPLLHPRKGSSRLHTLQACEEAGTSGLENSSARQVLASRLQAQIAPHGLDPPLCHKDNSVNRATHLSQVCVCLQEFQGTLQDQALSPLVVRPFLGGR